MKNILFCSPRGSVGGICRWTDNILAYAETSGSNDLKLSWYYSDIPEMALDKRSIIKRLISGIKVYMPFIRGLKKKIKKEHFDVAHFSTSGSISFARDFLALKMCRKANISTALHFHFGRMAQVLVTNSLEKKLFNFCIPYTSKYVAMDEETYKALLAYGCKNVHLVPNPLSLQVEAAINNLPKQQRNEKEIVYAGHVLRTKGVFELVEACRNIQGIKLEILGQCSSEICNALIEHAGPQASEWLNIRGNCSMAEVLNAMKHCAVFVLPSYSEGFPNVIIEAMACGAPIVATSVGAIPQMLSSVGNGNCGIVVPPHDAESLRMALIGMIENRKEAEEMGRNAVSKVYNSYSMDKVWAKLKNVWLDNE